MTPTPKVILFRPRPVVREDAPPAAIRAFWRRGMERKFAEHAKAIERYEQERKAA